MKKIFISLLFLLLLGVIMSSTAMAKEPIISPALNILAGKTDMAKAALVGENMGFTADDFLKAMNLKFIDGITVSALPKEEDGKLMLGKTNVSEGEYISADKLQKLTFVPQSKSVRASTFFFNVNSSEYALKCNMFFLDKINYSPTLSLVNKNLLTFKAHEETPNVGRLSSYDPEGDPVSYEIVKYPKNGSVVLSDISKGEYVYTPTDNFYGEDSFSYVARDVYGNYSAKAEVKVTVKQKQTNVVFGDISTLEVYNSALTMAENQLMCPSPVDGVTYFCPDQTISRGEFLALAMQSCGIDTPDSTNVIYFDDNDEIPKDVRDYVNTAYSLGIINGSKIDDKLCFLPNSTITRAEAAVMLNNILSYSDAGEEPIIMPTFADSSNIPSWAKESIAVMNHMGIISSNDGNASPESIVTRGDAACMLAQIIEIFN